MKKILMFGMSSYPGGIENYIKNYFCNKMVSENFIIDFITYEKQLAFECEINECGFEILRVPHLKKKPFGYFKAVKRAFVEESYDCVYVNMLSCTNFLPIKLAVKHGVDNIILHAHASDTVGLVRKLLHRLFKRYCNKHASLRLACGDEAGKWLFGNREFSIIPNAIDTARFLPNKTIYHTVRRKIGIADTDFVIGHVGRFASEKNHSFLIDVFQEVVGRKEKNIKLVLVGDGATREQIQNQVKNAGLENEVIFYGAVDDAAKLYQAFDCFAFPSEFEGFGISVLEAQATGLPCVVSDVLPESVDVTGEVRFLPLKDSVNLWADALLYTSATDAAAMNRAVANSEYNISQQISRLVNLLNEQE